MGRRKRLLVPEAREAMERLKAQVIQDQAQPTGGQSESVSRGTSAQNANLTSRQAGTLGGDIGGPMVKRLISLAEQSLEQERTSDGR